MIISHMTINIKRINGGMKMVTPLPLLELEKYDNVANEQNEEIKYWVEILENILPEYIGV